MKDLTSVVVLDNSYPKFSLCCNNNRCCDNKGEVLVLVVFSCGLFFFLIKQIINNIYSDLRSGSSCLFCTIFLFVPVILDVAVLIFLRYSRIVLSYFSLNPQLKCYFPSSES